MRCVAEKPKAVGRTKPAKASEAGQRRGALFTAPSLQHSRATLRPPLRSSRTIAQRERRSASSFPQFSLGDISILPRGQTAPQAKLRVGGANDHYEQQADRVADFVMASSARGATAPDIQHKGAISGANGEKSALASVPQAGPGSAFGQPIGADVRLEFSRKMGYDFSNVRVHTDEPAVRANQLLNARAFTHGSNIFFGKNEYSPHSSQGKRLLAHELSHVVQQSGQAGGTAQHDLIQRTSVGDVLDNFFAPWSYEKLWVMGPTDAYTTIVRDWQPVEDEMTKAKASIETKCSTWAANHTTSKGFAPTKTDPPQWDSRAYVRSVRGPSGTEPKTCKKEFIPYVASKAAKSISYFTPIPTMPVIETIALHRCAIGSFAVGVTVDTIDCASKTATMNVWMYNAMDQVSFGKFTSDPAFRLSGMQRQYMWWHWTETHSWGAAQPPEASAGKKDRKSEW